jgi:hypothetical protein
LCGHSGGSGLLPCSPTVTAAWVNRP